MAKNSFTLTTYISPFKANSSANWNAVSRQIWRGCHTSVDSGDKPSASKTISSVFHLGLHNTSATRELSVYLDGQRLRHECHPTYLGVTRPYAVLQSTLDEDCRQAEQELSYRQQIARQLRRQCVEGIYRPKYYNATLKSRLSVTQGHWKRNHWIDHTRLTIRPII